MSIAAMGLVGYPVDSVWFPLCVFSIASLVALAFVVLRSYGMQWAVAGSTLLATFGAATYYFRCGARSARRRRGSTLFWLLGPLVFG